jgi:peptidoglycan/LPS O-acetylase OafA/YrhL
MKKVNDKQSPRIITLSQSKSIKGIAAIEIVMGHLGIATQSLILYPNRKAGILFVGVFFLLSGYGLMSNLKKNSNYLKGFLAKKLLNIVLPAYIIYFLYLIISSLLSWNSIIQRPLYLLTEGFWRSTNWYVFEIIGLYILFFILFRWLPIKKALIILTVLIGVFIMVAFYLKIENPWYGSTLTFPLGILYAVNQQKIQSILERRLPFYIIALVMLLGVSIVTFYLLGDNNLLGNAIARNAAAIFFTLLLLIALLKYQIGNKVSRFLGEVSYEIFLIHPYVISIMKHYLEDAFLFSVLCFVITIILAYLIHFIMKHSHR